MLRSVLALVALVATGPSRTAQAGDALPPAIERWLHHEQRLLSRDVNTRRILSPADSDQAATYAPESGRTFRVESYWLDADAVDTYAAPQLEAGVEARFTRVVAGRRQIRFLVHAESRAYFADLVRDAEPAGDLLARATASSRTLLVWEPGRAERPIFAKVSLDRRIGGVVRTIPAGEVARSVGISTALHGDRDALPGSFDFLPEVLGVMPRGMERGGMILRQIPDDLLRGERRLVPLFSLYADPPGGGPPLLARMMRRAGARDPVEYVRRTIAGPFARQWFELALQHGITSEPHAQNVLLEVDRAGIPTGRFVHRDLAGFNVDFDFRARRGRPDPGRLPVATRFEQDYFTALHGETLRHVDTYFLEGFLYNIDQRLAAWRERGWVAGARVRPGAVRAMFEEELDLALRAASGGRGRLRGVADLERATARARRSMHEGNRAVRWLRGLTGRWRRPTAGDRARATPRGASPRAARRSARR